MRLLFNVFLVLLVICGVIFASLNSSSAEIDYFFSTVTTPLSVLLFICLAFGVVLGLIFTGYVYLKLKKENFKLRSQIKVARQEIDNLRSLPIKDSH